MAKRFTKIIFDKNLFGLLVFTTTNARLLDFSTAMYIPFRKGNVAIYQEFIYLIHTVNLTEFEVIAENIQNFEKLFKVKEEKASLEADFNEITKLLNSLRFHKQKRSIDFIGSALKFITGTPDHSDWTILQEKQSRLLIAENQQIETNTELTAKINELTTQINTIQRNSIRVENSARSSLFQLISIRNERAIGLLDNVVYSVTFARLNIVNPIILANYEIRDLINSNVTISLNDLMTASQVKVYSDESILKYLIKIPKIEEICPLVKVSPVVHNNTILNLLHQHISTCESGNQALRNCKEALSLSIWQKYPFDHCLVQIFSNATATCNTTTAHHISPIVQIDENTILINDNNARIIENGSEMATNGTFLLIHSNDVHINGTLYPVTSRKPTMEPQTPSVFNLKNLQKIDQMTDQFEAKKQVTGLQLLFSDLQC